MVTLFEEIMIYGALLYLLIVSLLQHNKIKKLENDILPK